MPKAWWTPFIELLRVKILMSSSLLYHFSCYYSAFPVLKLKKKKKTYLSPLSNRKVRMFKEDFCSNIFAIHLKERTHQKKITTLWNSNKRKSSMSVHCTSRYERQRWRQTAIWYTGDVPMQNLRIYSNSILLFSSLVNNTSDNTIKERESQIKNIVEYLVY